MVPRGLGVVPKVLGLVPKLLGVVFRVLEVVPRVLGLVLMPGVLSTQWGPSTSPAAPICWLNLVGRPVGITCCYAPPHLEPRIGRGVAGGIPGVWWQQI